MQLPADPCRELLRLWPRQQVTEIEGAQILSFAHPLAFIDQFAMHQGDLGGEIIRVREKADAQFRAERMAPRQFDHRCHSIIAGRIGAAHGA